MQRRKKNLEKIAKMRRFRFGAKMKREILSDKNIFDAVLCVLAAADFVKGDVIRPTNRALAKKEGWIWVKSPQSDAR